MKKMIRTTVMSISFLVAFLFMGLQTASAQWVGSHDAVEVVKQHVADLGNDFNQASTDAQRYDIALESAYYQAVLTNLTSGGMETPAAVENARIAFMPVVHSSGMVEISSTHPEIKTRAQALVDAATDLLND